MHVAGIDLGGTHMQIGVVDDGHQIVGRARSKTGASVGTDVVIDRMAQCVEQACHEAGIGVNDLVGIGVGAPSPIDPTGRIALNGVNIRWQNVPLADLMAERLDGVPVTLDNDVNVAVWGEYQLGAAANRGYRHIIGLWIGTGIGGGLILDGRLHHGTFGTAGEIGRSVLFPGQGPGFRLYEEQASRTAVVNTMIKLLHENQTSSVIDALEREGRSIVELTIADIASAVEGGDELAVDVVRHAAHLTGISTANVVTLLSADCVILGGGLTEALGDRFVQWVREEFDRSVFPPECRECDVVPTQLRDNAGLLGAALLARERLT